MTMTALSPALTLRPNRDPFGLALAYVICAPPHTGRYVPVTCRA